MLGIRTIRYYIVLFWRTIMASKRENIKLKSEAGTYIYTEKNKTNDPERISLKKYCPKQRKHVVFKETK